MPTSRGTLLAFLFFGASFFCVWNPEFLPVRSWLNDTLEYTIGWCR